jgi:hypothetical protein
VAAALLTATYVEVWWLAGCYAGTSAGVPARIDQIADRRVGDRLPHSPSGQPTSAGSAESIVESHLRHTVRELADLLGRTMGDFETD